MTAGGGRQFETLSGCRPLFNRGELLRQLEAEA